MEQVGGDPPGARAKIPMHAAHGEDDGCLPAAWGETMLEQKPMLQLVEEDMLEQLDTV